MQATVKQIKPIKVVRSSVKQLLEQYRQAVENASDCLEVHDADRVRIETYKTEDIRYLVETIWGWAATMAEIRPHFHREYPDNPNVENYIRQEQARVRKIKRLIPTKGAWPYVSYWAPDMEELMETTLEPNGEISVPNHGDGWHRVIAAIELGLPTIDVVFGPFHRTNRSQKGMKPC